ncbi:HNH endonuclease [bacterium]|nr:HNH endonuclease [bacterium]
MSKRISKYIKQEEVLSLNLPLRQRDVRHDGYYFQQYYYRTNIDTGIKILSELWISPKALQKKDERRARSKKKTSDTNRLFINRVKRRYGCQICGYKKSLSALEFHHLHSKKRVISRMSGYSRSTLKDEIKKCILVCSNCHSEIHDKEKKRGLV